VPPKTRIFEPVILVVGGRKLARVSRCGMVGFYAESSSAERQFGGSVTGKLGCIKYTGISASQG
jgi:hypothetical protein